MRKINGRPVFAMVHERVYDPDMLGLLEKAGCSIYAPGVIELDLNDATIKKIREVGKITGINPGEYLELKEGGVDVVHFYCLK